MKKSVPATGFVVTVLTAGLLLAACSEEQQPPAAQNLQPPPAPPVQQAAPVESSPVAPVAAQVATTSQATYSPESLESLLAPVALYPDPVLAQVLATSTNPQEVLDAGNWLLANPDLTGADLESAALEAAFTPPMVALVQFPTVVDMMCMEMDWTTELGTAFLADEPGVLGAVQRLRKQAADMGNLQSSEEMSVSTETQNNQEVIIVQPAQPEVVYVPQYDPATVYTTPPPAQTQTTQTTTTTEESSGHSTGALVATGLLAFGAGIVVNEVFSDDDDDYYYPNYGYYGGRPYYPPPYRPRYGNGYRPAHGYDRPNNYKNSFNNNNIYVNTGNQNYFNQFDRGKNNYRTNPKSPVTAARPNRPELASLNQQSKAASRSVNPRQAGERQVQGSYAGARDKAAVQRPATTAVKKPTGTYAGGKRPASQMSKPKTAGARDRGRVERSTSSSYTGAGQAATRSNDRPKAATGGSTSRQASNKRPSGLHGVGGDGKAERKASQRGRASMSDSARSAAKSKGRHKQRRG